MAGVIISDGNDNAHIQCPQCKSRPSVACLKHSEAAALPSQQKHIEEFHAVEAAKCAAEIQTPISQVRTQRSTPPESFCTTPSGVDVTDDEEGWDNLILEEEEDEVSEFEMELDSD
jgi:hypothetical protein